MAAPAPSDKVKDNEYTNWLKVTLALYYMKSGLHTFIQSEVDCLHKSLVQKIYAGQTVQPPRCTMCHASLVRRNKHTRVWKFQNQCKSKCDVWLHELLALHTNPKSEKIYWANSDVSLWPCNPWECAKVFLPRGQQPTNTSPAESDAQALMVLLSNCTHFHPKLSPQGQTLTHTISTIRNKVMHDGEMKVSDADRTSFIQQIVQLLEDPVSLKLSGDCKTAVNNIHKIDNDSVDVFFNLGLEMTALRAVIKELRQELGMQEIKYVDNVNSLKEEFRQLAKRVEDVEKKFVLHQESTTKRFEDVKKELELHGERVEKNIVKLQEVEENVEMHGGRLGAVEETVELHGERLGAVEEKVEMHEKRFGAVEQNVVKLQEEIGQMTRENNSCMKGTKGHKKSLYGNPDGPALKRTTKQKGTKGQKRRLYGPAPKRTSRQQETPTKRRPESDGLIQLKTTQSVIGRHQDIEGDLYTLSWSCYPRVEVFLEMTSSIFERFEKQMDRYTSLTQNQLLRKQYFSTRDSLDAMNKVPKIVIVGDLRRRVIVQNIAYSTNQLRDDERMETIILRNWSQYYQPEDPTVLVFTAHIITEDDFSRCIVDLKHILDGPFQRLLFVIETDPRIDRQSKQFIEFNSSITGHIEQHWKQGTTLQNCIIYNQLETKDVSNNISECLELGVVNLLNCLEAILYKNVKEKDVVSHIRFSKPDFVKNIKDAVTAFFTCDCGVADAILNGFQNEEDSMSVQALIEIVINAQLRIVREEMVKELSRSTGMEPETMNRVLDQVNFEQICKAGIKDRTKINFVEFLPPVVISYPCKYARDQKERERFRKLFKNRHHGNYIDALIVDLTVIIEDMTTKILRRELEKSFKIQEKLHFEVASLLQSTVAKEKFDYHLPPVELPSNDLFGIEEVEGFGIIYNKLQVHIKLKKPADEETVCKQIKAKLSNYRHPYKIFCIVQKAKPLSYVGGKLIALSQNRNCELGSGTIGALMFDLIGNLHILTCRHVVNLVRGRAGDMCFEDHISIGTAICVPDPAQNGPVEINFLDIAAVEVEVSQRKRCNTDFKKPDGNIGPSRIFSDPNVNICGLQVYKWGASTQMTQGIIVSANYRERELLPCETLHILIETQPGAAECVFADEGDSGATVCALMPNDPGKISVLAMIAAGRLELRDTDNTAGAEEEPQKVLGFRISDGIMCLNRSLPYPIKI